MALNKSILKNSLLIIFTTPSPNKTMSDHADELADAYDTYCKQAETAYAAKLITTGKTSFASTFLSLINIPTPILSNYGSAIESACISYWNSSAFPILTGIPPTISTQTITITPPTVTSISTTITSGLSPGVSASDAAEILSNSMDNGTKTVKTTHKGPSITSPFPVLTIGPTPII
jgi:hypothetical protein